MDTHLGICPFGGFVDTHLDRPVRFVDIHLVLPDADDSRVSNLFNLYPRFAQFPKISRNDAAISGTL